jgi:hypothetical protein
VEDGEQNFNIYSNLTDDEKNIINTECERLNANNFAKVSLLDKFTISGNLATTGKYDIVGYGNEEFDSKNTHYIKIVSTEALATITPQLKYVLFLGIFNAASE